MCIKKVALFGDSILRGVVLDESNRYCFSKNIDWSGIEQKLNVTIVNKSKFGCEIGRGQKILDDYLEIEKIDTAVIEYGGNDSDFVWKDVAMSPTAEHLSKTSLKEFAQRLRAMVSQLRCKGIKVVLMSLPPLDAERYLTWISEFDSQKADSIKIFLGDTARIYRYQEMYSNEITKLAIELGCEFVDIRRKFLESKNFQSLICVDGIHPNELGQKLIVDAFVEHFTDTTLAQIAN